MLALFGWWKKVGPIGKKLFRICSNSENNLVEVIRSRRTATYTRCEVDRHSLIKIMNIIAVMMSAGRMQAAANFCKMIAEKCFGQSPDNPYRLMFLSIAMMAECEAKFYDLSFFRVCGQEQPLKIRYSICHQSATGFLVMEPTIFKIADLLTMCEEFSHFSCFRQCLVNLFTNLAEIGEDENVDWSDRVESLDSNILGLIADSDVAARLCKDDKQKRELQRKVYNNMLKWDGQYCFSWFNHLHFREICVRANAAIEVLKSEQNYKNFVKGLPESSKSRRDRKKLEPRNPEVEVKKEMKEAPAGENSSVLVDPTFQRLRKLTKEKTRQRRRLTAPENVFSTDVEEFNYTISLGEDGKTYSSIYAEKLKDFHYYRKQRQRFYDGGGKFPIDPRKRMPGSTRTKIRMIVRKIMSDAREIQQSPVIYDELLNRAFPISDDERSDDESAAKQIGRTETWENVRKKSSRKFGILDPKSGVKKVLWWNNAKDELLTVRAIPRHCVKPSGERSEPFAEYEHYLGKKENGEKEESTRNGNCRQFQILAEANTNDGALLKMGVGTFSNIPMNQRKTYQRPRLSQFTLQNMRRRCVDELLVLMMIIKGQEQLQDGNVVRCMAYLMFIEYKFALAAENSSEPYYAPRKNNFDPYLMHLYKCLIAKFRMYAIDLFGKNCLSSSEEKLLRPEKEKFDLNQKCFDFCMDTKVYFFCICIRGRMVQFDVDDLKKIPAKKPLNREEIEKQLEFFFGLDNINKNGSLNRFWEVECAPIISGLVHITHHSYLESVDKMCSSEAEEFLEKMPGLTRPTKDWFKLVTKNGFLHQRPSGRCVTYKETLRSMVPMLVQYPSRVYPRCRTDDMMDPSDLEHVYNAITKFVQEKNAIWKQACKADKANLRRTNRDYEYRSDDDMTFFGESIEKDIYMVAVYKGEKTGEESQVVTDGMLALCREIRSQSGFITIRQPTV